MSHELRIPLNPVIGSNQQTISPATSAYYPAQLKACPYYRLD
jgi:hypothetical protein